MVGGRWLAGDGWWEMVGGRWEAGNGWREMVGVHAEPLVQGGGWGAELRAAQGFRI